METLSVQHNRIQIYPSTEELSHAAAQLFVQTSQETLEFSDRFAVVLSGGSTPEPVYRLLAQEPYREHVRWSNTHVFWGDERCVPRNHAENNAHMAWDRLLRHVPIPRNQVHPILSEEPPPEAANHYETILRVFFHDTPARFDLVFLGLGGNGHTASLFPHTPILKERDRWVKEVFVPELNRYRVSLTAPIVNQASRVVFLAHGRPKAQVLKDVLVGPLQPEELPAQLIRPASGQILWLVDRDAASGLAR
jgi:6-phosphogluconolactonase